MPLCVRLAWCLYVVGITILHLSVRLARCLYVAAMYYPAFVCQFGMVSICGRDVLFCLCLSVWHGVYMR